MAQIKTVYVAITTIDPNGSRWNIVAAGYNKAEVEKAGRNTLKGKDGRSLMMRVNMKVVTCAQANKKCKADFTKSKLIKYSGMNGFVWVD